MCFEKAIIFTDSIWGRGLFAIRVGLHFVVYLHFCVKWILLAAWCLFLKGEFVQTLTCELPSSFPPRSSTLISLNSLLRDSVCNLRLGASWEGWCWSVIPERIPFTWVSALLLEQNNILDFFSPGTLWYFLWHPGQPGNVSETLDIGAHCSIGRRLQFNVVTATDRNSFFSVYRVCKIFTTSNHTAKSTCRESIPAISVCSRGTEFLACATIQYWYFPLVLPLTGYLWWWNTGMDKMHIVTGGEKPVYATQEVLLMLWEMDLLWVCLIWWWDVRDHSVCGETWPSTSHPLSPPSILITADIEPAKGGRV